MNRKHWLLLFSLVALAALVVLASGLGAVHFQPGKPFGTQSVNLTDAQTELNDVVQQIAGIPLWKQIVFWSAVALSIIFFAFLLPPEMRKRFILQAVRYALAIGIIFYLIKNRLIQLPALNLNFANQGQPLSLTPGLILNASKFQPPNIAPWMNYLVSLGVVLAFLVLIWIAYRFWIRFRPLQHSHQLDELAEITRSSLDDLASGHEWQDVIIQSYARMSEVVTATRGLNRADAMTPREFAGRLERAGLPANSVARLTRLFESVRYGVRKSNQADINEAVACLNSILDYCAVAQ